MLVPALVIAPAVRLRIPRDRSRPAAPPADGSMDGPAEPAAVFRSVADDTDVLQCR